MPSEKVIEKLKKIKKMHEGAKKIGSEAEAQSFAELLQKLMVEHRVEMSDIEDAEAKAEPLVDLYFIPSKHKIEVKSQKAAPVWLLYLAKMIGDMHACATSGISDCNWVVIHGRKQDTQLCSQTLEYLGRAAMRLAMVSYRKTLADARAADYSRWDIKTITKGYKESFLYGFCSRIDQRLQESRIKIEQESSVGLMRISQDLVRASKSLSQQLVPSGRTVKSEINLQAYVDGVTVANQQPLAPAGELTA